MRIVVVPDSFKESMTAPQAARAMAAGAREALPSCEVDLIPVSDGGEGFARAVTEAWGASWHRVETVDALGRARTAGFGLDGGRAVVDLASSVGIEHVAAADRDAMRSSTAGMGRVLAAAADAGARSLLIGLGGSASNDLGLGLLTALGARCLDAHGRPVAPVPAAFSSIAAIETGPARRRVEGIDLTLACDVTNPLTGPRGAAAVFGPQKGLTAAQIEHLDAQASRLAALLKAGEWVTRPGTGAAGGTAFALAAVLGAGLVPGIDCLAQAVGLRRRIQDADLVLTGEGSLDAQSLEGKAVSGMVRLARECAVPVIILAGRVDAGSCGRGGGGNDHGLADLGAEAVIRISDPSVPLRDALAQGPQNLRRCTARAVRRWAGA
ncbi:glycerate kinase [uncultured Actinomyces sp.]|uniref:glycerate kinase n=1 Tax=uncultured Actinomyces sp. TaxID=249061 RepID=UPI0028E5F2D9|nr:glycerate kinase [uncultured Actinomyces sp.]